MKRIHIAMASYERAVEGEPVRSVRTRQGWDDVHKTGLALQNVLQTLHMKLDKTIFSTMYSTRNTHIVHRNESVSVACVLVTVC